MSGLSYSAAVQQYSQGQARASSDSLRAEPEVGGPAGRRQILEAQLSVRAGRSRASLSSLQELLDSHPRNPLGQYLGALAYWDNDEP